MNLLFKCLLIAISQSLCSCTLLMTKVTVTDAHPKLNENSTREQIQKALGKPIHSETFATPRPAKSVVPEVYPKIAKTLVSGYDDFVISGLVNMDANTDGSTTDGVAMWGALVVATGGLAEVLGIPTVAYNLAKSKGEKFSVRVWYDNRRRYLTHRQNPINVSN